MPNCHIEEPNRTAASLTAASLAATLLDSHNADTEYQDMRE